MAAALCWGVVAEQHACMMDCVLRPRSLPVAKRTWLDTLRVHVCAVCCAAATAAPSTKHAGHARLRPMPAGQCKDWLQQPQLHPLTPMLTAPSALPPAGNKAFKEAKYRRAVQVYEKAVGLVQHDTNFPEELKPACRELKRSCWLNLAACCLKLAKPGEVVKHCGKVLEMEPGNVKALYRCAGRCVGGWVPVRLDAWV